MPLLYGVKGIHWTSILFGLRMRTNFVNYVITNKKIQGIYAKIAPTAKEFGQSSVSGWNLAPQVSTNL